MRDFVSAIFFVLASLSVQAQVPNYVATDGLLGWWPFSGNANDASGNGNNGVSIAALSNDRFGNPASAYSFNGFTYVDLPASLGAVGTGSYSLSAWFISGSNGLHNIARFSSCVGVPDWGVRLNAGKLEFFEVSPLSVAETAGTYNDNQWHHVVVSRDAVGLRQRIYIDGLLVIDLPMSGAANMTLALGTVFRFGSCAGFEYFVGGLDDYGFWNRVLTQSEVTALFTQVVTCDDPLACNFNESGSCTYANPFEDCNGQCLNDVNANGICDESEVEGCTDPMACNFNDSANIDDGSCALPDGCTDPNACNYNALALCDDETCQLPDGCTDEAACNYDPFALCDNGSCTTELDCNGVCGGSFVSDPCGNCFDPNLPAPVCPEGCTNPLACNYNPAAGIDDGSCQVPPVLNLGDDIADCEGSSFVLDAGAGFDSYLWSTGETTQSITVDVSDTYSVETTFGNIGGSNEFALRILGDQWVNIPSFSTTPSYTVGAWIKFPIPGSNFRTLFQRTGGNWHHILFTPQGQLGLFNSGFFGVNVFEQNLSPGYHHVAAVAAGSQTTFYVDGVSVGSVNSKITEPVEVMGNHTGDGNQAIGHFDNAMIWNVALTPAQIVEAMCPPEPGTPGLVAYYTFEEGSGNTIIDISGNNRNGTRQGAPAFVNDAPDTQCATSCSYSDEVTVSLLPFGCTDEIACNYDPSAGCDDGSCIIPELFNGFTLGEDITACEGDTVTLQAPPGFDSYLWPDGSAGTSFEVTTSGTYSVSAGVLLEGATVSNLGSGSFQSGQRATIPAWTPTASYTLAAQVQFPLPSTTFNTLFMRAGGTYHHIIFQDGELGVYNFDFFGSGWNASSASPGFHHIAAVASGSQTMFYVDGIHVGTSNSKVTQNLEVIGNFSDGTQPIGLADEIQIWNSALSLQQIANTMECRPEPNTPGLVGLWSMDEVVGGVVPDLTGNGRNASLLGGASIVASAPVLSCQEFCYVEDSVEVIFLTNGCTDPAACNYDESAGCDDGSCVIAPALELGEDQVVCAGDSIVLAPGSGFDHYIWNGQPGSQTFTATTTGTYEVIGVIGDSPYVNQRAVRTSANNQYISFPSVTPTNDFSLTLWVKFPLTTTSEGWRTLWEKSGGDDHHVIVNSAGALGLYTTQFVSTGFNVNTLSAGWHHVTSVKQGNQTSFYIDGALVGSVNAIVSAPVNVIGGHVGSPQHIGSFDEAAIWQRALTVTEIAGLMNCENFLNDPDLIAYYAFEEESGSTAFDSSPNGLNATLLNTTRITDVPANTCVTVCEVVDSVFIEFQASGCTDPTACNFDESAICDDGSCTILPVLDLGVDLSFCGGDSLTLDAGAGFDYYIWSTGDSTQTITVSETGTFSVIAGTGEEEQTTNPFSLQGAGIQVVAIPSWAPTPQNSLGAWVQFPLPSGGAGWNTLFGRTNGTFHHIIFSPQGELGVYNTNAFFGCGFFESQIAPGWHHVMAVASGGQTQFFFDGVSVGTANNFVTGNVEIIGGQTFSKDPQPIGRYDEIQMWSVALSQSEVEQYMNCPPTGDESGLVAYFNCNEGSGNTLQNLRSGGFNGSLQGVVFNSDTPELSCLPPCALTDTINVWQLGTGITPGDTTICIGSSIGLQVLQLPDSTLYAYDVLWSTNESSDSVNVTPEQTLEVNLTVSDAMTVCQDTVLITVNNPQFSFAVDTLSHCNIDSLLLEGPADFDAYLWSNGANEQSTSVSNSGAYQLTVFDTIGCAVTDSLIVSIVNAGINLSDTTLCIGDSIELSVLELGGTNGEVYFNDFESGSDANWNTSSTLNIGGSGTLGNFSNGTVLFTLNNLPSHDEVTVTFDLLIIDSWDGNAPTVGGELWELAIDNATLISTQFANGSATQCYPNNCPAANPAGSGNSGTVPPLCLGNQGYRYQITRTVPHSSSTLEVAMIASGLQALCDESWAIDNFRVEVSSSESFNSVVWSTGETTTVIEVSPNELTTYYVEMSDGITTCIDSVSVGVSNPIPSFANDSLQVCGNELFEIGLEQPWSGYSWSTGESSPSIQINTTGMYTVEVADSLDCRAADSLFVYFTQMNITQVDTAICIGSEVLLSVEDDLPLIEWSTGETLSTISVTPENDTLIFVSYPLALRNCTDSVSIEVSNLQIDFSTVDVTCFGLSNGTANANVAGGLEPYTFNWFGADPQALAPGAYTFQLIDSIGCSYDTSFVVTQPLPLVAAGFAFPESCVDNNDGKLAFAAAGGTAPYNANWPNGTDSGYGNGQYDFVVTDALGCTFDISVDLPETTAICGCTYALAVNYDPSATVDDGSCEYGTQIPGCTDQFALNYMPSATEDDGSCTYDTNVYGCTYPLATNYDETATADDGSCIIECTTGALGCTDSAAINYMPSATEDDGSCFYDTNVYGCLYTSALNFNPQATADNGTCLFPTDFDSCPADINNDGLVNASDLSLFLSEFGTFCGSAGIPSDIYPYNCNPESVFSPQLALSAVTDVDGNVYRTLVIAGREVMAENLRVTHFANGDPIPVVTDAQAWSDLSLTEASAMSHSNDDSATACPYGVLYNYYTVVDCRDVCPSGWHVPTSEEWDFMTTYLGGTAVAGGALKSINTDYWSFPNTDATNSSGFSALPAGSRSAAGDYTGFGSEAFWWTATQVDSQNGSSRGVLSTSGELIVAPSPKTAGYSVRCIKDL